MRASWWRQAWRSRRPRWPSRRPRPTTPGPGWCSAGRSSCPARPQHHRVHRLEAARGAVHRALALFGAAAPSLWLVVVRTAGLAALALAFRLAARVGGPAAGAIAALALLARDDWLRFLSAGNIEPLVVALMLGAIELHLRRPARRAFLLGALAGLARPEVWPLVGAYAVYLALTRAAMVAARARHPGHVRPVDRARLDGLGGSAAHLPPGPASAASRTRSSARAPPALGLLRGAGAIAPAPVWIGTLSALAFGWRNRDRTVAALALVAAAWARPTVRQPLSATRRCRATCSSPWPSAASLGRDRRRSQSYAWRPVPAAAPCSRWPWSP